MRFHLYSGNTPDLMERLDKGLLDFAVLINPPDLFGYDSIRLPYSDVGGLLMRKDSPLAENGVIKREHMSGIPIIASRNTSARRAISEWLGRDFDTLNVVATYNLIFNAALMVEEGMGYAMSQHNLIDVSQNDALCFRPYEALTEITLSLVWKKNHVFSNASIKFLEQVRNDIMQQAHPS